MIWLLRESPPKTVEAPQVPTDQVQPLSPEKGQQLVDAATTSRPGPLGGWSTGVAKKTLN